MSGISIKIGLTDEEARASLQQLLERMDDRRGFYKGVGERLVGSTAENFRRQSAPDGTPWLSLRPATIKARERKGQLPLTILRSNSKGQIGSSLAGSINYEATTEGVRIGSSKETAAIHQLGGTIQKPASKRWMAGRRFAKRAEHSEGAEVDIKAHSIRIPARPYLGVSKADEAAILEDAEDWLTR